MFAHLTVFKIFVYTVSASLPVTPLKSHLCSAIRICILCSP